MTPPPAPSVPRPLRRDWHTSSHVAFSIPAWPRSPTLLILLAGVFLPNLLSLATLGNFLDVGLPPRTGCILLYAALAMTARLLPFAAVALLYVAIVAFDIVWTLTVSFGMRPHDLITAIDQARRIHVLSSPLYAALIGVIAATTLSALYLMSRRNLMAKGNLVVVFGTGLALATVDFMTNSDAHYNFGAIFGAHVPIVSAVNDSGFDRVAGVNSRNVVLVIVEKFLAI